MWGCGRHATSGHPLRVKRNVDVVGLGTSCHVRVILNTATNEIIGTLCQPCPCMQVAEQNPGIWPCPPGDRPHHFILLHDPNVSSVTCLCRARDQHDRTKQKTIKCSPTASAQRPIDQ